VVLVAIADALVGVVVVEDSTEIGWVVLEAEPALDPFDPLHAGRTATNKHAATPARELGRTHRMMVATRPC
jgi:hypothetical protein